MIKNYASVSVVIPCYRCSETIERAIDSVYNQELLPFEVILVDDFSNDETLSFLYELSRKYPLDWIKIIESPINLGPGSARNLGWNMSTQDYIAFLDSDDSWHPSKISIQYSWMSKNPDVALTGHNTEVAITNNKQVLIESSDFYGVGKYKLLIGNRFSTTSVMLKRTLKQRFPSGRRYSEDYSLWLDICFSDEKCARSDKKLAYMYKYIYRDSGLSSHLFEMQKGEIQNYKSLYKRGDINIIYFSSIFLYSYLKFSRRLIKVYSSIKKT